MTSSNDKAFRMGASFAVLLPTLLLVVDVAEAQPSKAKVVIPSKTEFVPSASGTIRDNLPKPPVEETKKIRYPKPGEVSITGSRICGDGDVESFAKSHPTFDFVHNEDPDVGVVTGFWVRSGTQAKWFPSARGALKVANDTVTKLDSVADGGNQSITVLALETLENIQAARGFKLPAAEPVKGDVFFGAMICRKDHLEKSIPKDKAPSNAALGYAMQTTVQSEVSKGVDLAVVTGDFTKIDTFTLTVLPSGLKLDLGAGTGSLSPSTLANLGKRVAAMVYPKCGAAACDLKGYVGAMSASSEGKSLQAIYGAMQSAKECAAVPGVRTPRSGFFWEPIPLQTTCGILNGGGAFTSAGSGLMNPSAVPAEDAFNNLKREMAGLLLKAGLWEEIALSLNGRSALYALRDTCVPAAGPYIDKVMGSLTVGGQTKNGSLSLTTNHAEGDFLSRQGEYFAAPPAGSNKTIFGMGGDTTPLFQLNQGGAPSGDGGELLSGSSILLNFKIRGLGCCGQEPCFC